jgi:hypothetical protein
MLYLAAVYATAVDVHSGLICMRDPVVNVSGNREAVTSGKPCSYTPMYSRNHCKTGKISFCRAEKQRKGNRPNCGVPKARSNQKNEELLCHRFEVFDCKSVTRSLTIGHS